MAQDIAAATFRKEVQDLKDLMTRKTNVHFLHSTSKLHRGLRSVSPTSNEDFGLRASYDNVNLVNHLPFAGKNVKDITSDERFKSYYA